VKQIRLKKIGPGIFYSVSAVKSQVQPTRGSQRKVKLWRQGDDMNAAKDRVKYCHDCWWVAVLGVLGSTCLLWRDFAGMSSYSFTWKLSVLDLELLRVIK